jgi:hypothetical protein
MDPRGVGPVTIELNNTLAQLLGKLSVELDTENYAEVLSRALAGCSTWSADPPRIAMRPVEAAVLPEAGAIGQRDAARGQKAGNSTSRG